MALRGTLKDFGIADILQLIGHQQKTGTLSVKNRDQEVQIHFLDGTPTSIVFDLERDEPAVLDWIGLPGLDDGQAGWVDLAARPEDT